MKIYTGCPEKNGDLEFLTFCSLVSLLYDHFQNKSTFIYKLNRGRSYIAQYALGEGGGQLFYRKTTADAYCM